MGAHPLLALQLEFIDAQCPLTGGHGHTVLVRAEDLSRPAGEAVLCVRRRGPPDFQLLPVIAGESAGPRGHGPYPAVYGRGILGKVNLPHALVNHRRMAAQVIALLLRDQPPLFQKDKRLRNGPATQLHQFVMQSLVVILRRNGDFLFIQHIAGVNPGIHLHNGDARPLLPIQNDMLNGRGPPVLRKQRSMDIQASKRRNVQNLLGQNLPESRHYIKVRLIPAKLLHRLRRLDPPGLHDRDAI